MIVEYNHSRYDLGGTVNTDNYATHFVFARKSLAVKALPVITEQSKSRFMNEIEPIATLNQFETIAGTETSDPIFIRISGNIITEPPESVYADIPVAAMHLFGPITPEFVERSMAHTALARCAMLIVRDFEDLMVPR